MRIFYKSQITFLSLFLFVTSCAGPNTQICYPGSSLSCLRAKEVWGQSINRVVVANFPDELGFYKPVVHKANFSNAWVTTGGEINITLNLLSNLGETGRICVISHELAHLKSNHYFSKVGISTFTSAVISAAGTFVPGLGYLDHFVNPAITNSFGRQFELSADKLAVEYIKKTGLAKVDYVKFLYWMKENLDSSGHSAKTSIFSTHPATQERINELMGN
ncbi:M48 family metallopeptidase [Nitrospinaceae bacterium]|nr:M48 family metallopeptidase [Nitrospinaceae bacterium]